MSNTDNDIKKKIKDLEEQKIKYEKYIIFLTKKSVHSNERVQNFVKRKIEIVKKDIEIIMDLINIFQKNI